MTPARTHHPATSRAASQRLHCKPHADDGTVDVLSKQCSDDAFTRTPRYYVQGTKTVIYGMRHSEVGIVDVRAEQCSDDSCTIQRSFNVKGRKAVIVLQATG